MPDTSAAAKASSHCSARACAAASRGSRPASRSQVPTYRAGSATSRCTTQASTPSAGSQEETRARQSSPSTCTQAASIAAVPPGFSRPGACPTTSSLAPSSARPESR
ncbi:Uncharacterised protein [Mycobacteroides abscessus subsp. abscessus]|nr:Uncharacterised protein [Mycobacteroides abscessus subsp. abscessus]